MVQISLDMKGAPLPTGDYWADLDSLAEWAFKVFPQDSVRGYDFVQWEISVPDEIIGLWEESVGTTVGKGSLQR